MKRLGLTLALVLIVGLIYVGNVYSGSDDDMASKLWSKLQSDNYTANWKTWPGRDKMYKGTPPHGALLTTYLNNKAYNAIEKKEEELPYGSILVKENYMPDKKLGAVTVMSRVKDYNPDAGDWFWVKFAPDGKPLTMEKDGKSMTLAGKVPGCIGCHQSSTSGTKFIMTQ